MRPVVFLVQSVAVITFLAARPGLANSYVITPINVPGGSSTQVAGINDLGQIVGTFSNCTGEHAFVDTNGSFTTFGPAGLLPTGINNAGQVTGGYLGLGSVSGSFSAIPPPGGIFFGTDALGINNKGDVVGQLSASATIGAFLYSEGMVTVLSNSATPRGISDTGEIVGYAVIGNPYMQGVRSFFTIEGVSTAFSAPGAFVTMAAGVNDNGQIVGTFGTGPGFPGAPFEGFIDDNGVFSNLVVPGSTNTGLNGINDAGQIIGTYADSNFVSHSFLATPVPEPAFLCLVGIVLLGCGVLRRYR